MLGEETRTRQSVKSGRRCQRTETGEKAWTEGDTKVRRKERRIRDGIGKRRRRIGAGDTSAAVKVGKAAGGGFTGDKEQEPGVLAAAGGRRRKRRLHDSAGDVGRQWRGERCAAIFLCGPERGAGSGGDDKRRGRFHPSSLPDDISVGLDKGHIATPFAPIEARARVPPLPLDEWLGSGAVGTGRGGLISAVGGGG